MKTEELTSAAEKSTERLKCFREKEKEFNEKYSTLKQENKVLSDQVTIATGNIKHDNLKT